MHITDAIQTLRSRMMNWEASARVDDEGEMTSIIEDGRFVLPGTEELNEPFAE